MTTARQTVEALRRLADTIEAVDAESPLPELYMGLSVQVSRNDAPEADRIEAVTRLSLALGNETFEVERFDGNEAHYTARSAGRGPYAYTALDHGLNAVSA